MNCNEVNNIPIFFFLQSQGIDPVRIRGREAWYLSPIRLEKTPSFKVDLIINRWFDHGIGQGGKLVDLGILLLKVSVGEFLTFAQLLKFPEQKTHEYQSRPRSLEIVKVEKLQSRALMSFLKLRGIPPELASKFCKEIHYSIDGRIYYAIGFPNDVGGFEVRNRFFKGCIGSKSPTSFLRSGQPVSLFEGFFDFLSAIQLGILSENDSAIVLNSVNQLATALRQLETLGTTSINAFFDNDAAGQKCFHELVRCVPAAIDHSALYKNFKDVNEMLVTKNQSI